MGPKSGFFILIAIFQSTTLAHEPKITGMPLSLKPDKFQIEKSSTLTHKKTVVCILDSWSYWREDPHAKFDISDVDPTLCTQLVYRNARIDNLTYAVVIRDTELADNRQHVKKAIALSQQHSHLKVLLSVGGWDEGSKTFSIIAADSEKRKIFVESVLRVLDEYKFHGLDVGWEYPAWHITGGQRDDKDNLPLLLNDLRDNFKQTYLLSLTVPGDTTIAVNGYEVNSISKVVDQINIKSFDYAGAWTDKASHQSAFRGVQSVANSVQFYLREGCPPEKLILGIPFSGRTVVLQREPPASDNILVQSGLGQASTHKGFSGSWVPDHTSIGFHELCFNIKNKGNLWQTYTDITAVVPFARKGVNWVSYDDASSIENKVEYAIREKLKGVMAWAIDTDDFKGTACKTPSDEEKLTYPLLRTINFVLSANESQELGRSGSGLTDHSNHKHNHADQHGHQTKESSSAKSKNQGVTTTASWTNLISSFAVIFSLGFV